jgi:hypothetical protein
MMEKVSLPAIPIQEWLERKIDKWGRDKVWGDNSDWSNSRISSDDEAALLVYDGALCTIKPKHVCAHCLVTEARLYRKFYDDDEFKITIE